MRVTRLRKRFEATKPVLLRHAIAVLLAFGLSGCIAMSDKPILAGISQSGQAVFDDGVWLFRVKDQGDCNVDIAQPVSMWPHCATWLVHRDGAWTLPAATGDPDRQVAQVIVAHDAANAIGIVQMPLDTVMKYATDSAPPIPPDAARFVYFAFSPDPATGAGLSSVTAWVIPCGRWVREDIAGTSETALNFKHFPGFDGDCQPTSIQSLRTAARLSSQPDEKDRVHFFRARATLD